MPIRSAYQQVMVALLVAGSAILLFSCRSEPKVDERNPETLMTQSSDTLTLIVSENGHKRYRFKTPLMERYELAREPYMEFRYGVDIETYKDSTEVIESTLVADYAIFYENRELWEARGNVVATGMNNQTLYTQQLFWDQKTRRVYSNVDSKVVQGDDVFVGEGFESDDKFEMWTFRNYVGKLALDVSPNEQTDSLEEKEKSKGEKQGGSTVSDNQSVNVSGNAPLSGETVRRESGPTKE